MKPKKIFIVCFVLVAFFTANAQINDNNICQEVLKKAIVDELSIYGKWSEGGGTETHLRYLGKVKTKHGKVFKVVNSTFFWGLSHRATSRILVFDGRNQYLGNYPVTMITDLPTKLDKGKLIFSNTTNKDCDRQIKSIIDLNNGLPNEFFRKCKGKSGDIYVFEKE